MPAASSIRATSRARDRLARRRLLVLARVAVPRRYRDHAVRRAADGRIDHREQLHQRVVGAEAVVRVRAGRLHDEHVGAAHRLLVAAVDLAVGERLERHGAELHAELRGDLGGQLRVGAPRDQHQSLVVLDAEIGRRHGTRLQDAHPARECTPGGRRDGVHRTTPHDASSEAAASRCLRRSAYPSMFRWRERATPSAPAGTSLVMTEPAAV